MIGINAEGVITTGSLLDNVKNLMTTFSKFLEDNKANIMQFGKDIQANTAEFF